MEEHFMSDLGTRVRERITPPPGGAGGKNAWTYSIENAPNTGKWNKYTSVSQDITGYPYLTAEKCWDDIHPGPPFRQGGPFKKIKLSYTMPFGAQAIGRYVTNSAGYVVTPFGNGHIRYEGGFLPPGDWPFYWEQNNLNSVLTGDSPLFPDVGPLGQKAWDKTKPRIEQGGLFVAVAELKDIPKMFQTTAKAFTEAWNFSHKLFTPNLYKSGRALKRELFMAPKKAADHFVNHNFGWVPFLKDLADFLSNLRDYKSKIERLSKENGQWVRRRSTLINTSLDEKVPGWSGTGIHNVWPLTTSPANDTWVGTPSWEYRHKVQTVATAVGSFRYYLPEFDVSSPEWGGLGVVRRSLALFGARVNPYHIYQAVPWSWLVDWLTPVGHDLQVLQDQVSDNLVAKYLYTTLHSISTVEFQQYVPFNSASGGPRTLTWSRILETKERKEAGSPFGFGLSWDDLSPKQLMILGALGILRT
jgi:hypothetical protein